jgi:DNA-binding CsgD family transcriptional regulator
LRRTDRARQLLHRYATDAEAIGRRSALAIVSRSRGLIDDDESIDEHFALAHHHHRLAPDRYQQARTDLCWGMRLRRARRKSDARNPLRNALRAFDAMGASPWAACAASELAACGERRRTAWPGVDELTPRELDVALAVADGATNPAVAAALGISVRTIEDHLTRIYRKLGIAGRGALPAALVRSDYSPAAAST